MTWVTCGVPAFATVLELPGAPTATQSDAGPDSMAKSKSPTVWLPGATSALEKGLLPKGKGLIVPPSKNLTELGGFDTFGFAPSP